MSTRDPIEVVEPTPEDVELARRSRKRVAQVLAALDAAGGGAPAGSLADVELPAAAVRALARVLDELADGRAVAVHVGGGYDLTLDEAAEILGVSTVFLVNLLDTEPMPIRWEGHRRYFRLADVLEYKRRVNPSRLAPPKPSYEERLRLLREMAEITQEQ